MWAGYDPPNASERTLIVAYYLLNFCSYSSSSTNNLVANQTVLDEFICQKGRTGRLCGSCIPGYSMIFTSLITNARKSDLCSVGWLFYILSELVPSHSQVKSQLCIRCIDWIPVLCSNI